MSDHHHHHGGQHQPSDLTFAFAVGISLNFLFVIVEGFFGYYAQSLALLADAGHNFSDVLGLVLAWLATSLAKRRPSPEFTYGLRSSPGLAALANAILLLLAVGAVMWEAVLRLTHPSAVNSQIVMIVAAVGILINGGTAVMFLLGDRQGVRRDLNIRGAITHMASDALISVAVVAGGAVIYATGLYWFDPALSLFISLIIIFGTWSLFRDSLRLVLLAVPAGIDAMAIRQYLESLPGVARLHDLHIWGMSTTETALTVHLVMPAANVADDFLLKVSDELLHRYHIGHSTIQIEHGSSLHLPCPLEPDEVV
jgi:cobalt-zinc-cadmium efflux system protein